MRRSRERIEHRDAEPLEVTDVSRNNGQPVNDCDAGDKRVLEERVGLAVHELGPLAECGSVHG